MNLFTFKKGIHPPHGKYLSENKEIEEYLPKGLLVFPMSQHIGAPCKPIVKKGDKVLVGQKIGEAEGFVSAPIFSSVSGIVKDVSPKLTASGSKSLSVIIENDNNYEASKDLYTKRNVDSLSNDEIKSIIKDSGIVGMGGACFPTHIKLSPGPDKKIDSIIVNAAECEPYLTCDHRLMLEEGDKIVSGLKLILKLFPGAKGYIGIENNKMDAVKIMEDKVKNLKNIEVKVLKTKYPQGAEKQLIYAITNREVPSGKLPADVGCIVQNAATVHQIYTSLSYNVPLIERVLTVTGESIKTPKNIRVKIGTSFKEIIEFCDGFSETPIKIISGGPMMGMTISSLDIPVVKGTSGILALSEKQAKIDDKSACIRCGKCIAACPMNLLPEKLHKLALKENFEEFKALNGLDCIECGCCSFSCPAKRHIVQNIRMGKRIVILNSKKAK